MIQLIDFDSDDLNDLYRSFIGINDVKNLNLSDLRELIGYRNDLRAWTWVGIEENKLRADIDKFLRSKKCVPCEKCGYWVISEYIHTCTS